jgi:segregation and condensation protein B
MKSMDSLPDFRAAVEALIFAAEQAMPVQELAKILSQYYENEVSDEMLEAFLQELQAEYSSGKQGFELVKTGGGYLFLTKKQFQPLLSLALTERSKKRLSPAALETLSIIAYKQPVTKAELEHIRGVNCDYSIQRLLERKLIVISGRTQGPGRPLSYATSDSFMEYFGLNSLDELPQLKALDNQENSIGQAENEE